MEVRDPGGAVITVVTHFIAASWGGLVAIVFIGLVQAETGRVVAMALRPGRTVRRRGRFLRWAAISGALFVPALWGTAVIAALLGFDAVRRLRIRLEAARGD